MKAPKCIEKYFEHIRFYRQDQKLLKKKYIGKDMCPFCGSANYKRLVDNYMFWIVIAHRCLFCGRSWVIKRDNNGNTLELKAARLPRSMFDFYEKNYSKAKKN